MIFILIKKIRQHRSYARFASTHAHPLDKSDKRRHFCPSCHQKRVVEFGEWLCEEVLKAVPHRHFVFTIRKILRRYFLYDRKLLSDLSPADGGTGKP